MISEIGSYLPDFLQAMWVTLYISLLGSCCGILLSGLFFFLKSKNQKIEYFIKTYIWLIRGTPFLSQLMVIYFGLPAIGLTLDSTMSCIIALGFYSAAYFYEIFRSAWSSIPTGQTEASIVHGIKPYKAFIHIQMPQALGFALPMLGNQVINLLKESSIASVITVPELTMTTGSIVANNFSYVIPYGLMILAYWILTESVGICTSQLTQKFTHYKRA